MRCSGKRVPGLSLPRTSNWNCLHFSDYEGPLVHCSRRQYLDMIFQSEVTPPVRQQTSISFCKKKRGVSTGFSEIQEQMFDQGLSEETKMVTCIPKSLQIPDR
jgi:hypothetical protein